MPELLRIFGLRFFFYSDEHHPIHVHVETDGHKGKIVLEPEVTIEYNHGIKPKDMKRAVEIVRIYRDEFIEKWNEYFDE